IHTADENHAIRRPAVHAPVPAPPAPKNAGTPLHLTCGDGAAGPFRSSRPRLPSHTRESPQRQGRKGLRFTGIPAYPRSARKRHDRPVTPEVAGSSPVVGEPSYHTE